MTDAPRKTLTLPKKDMRGAVSPNEKSVESLLSELGKTLDHQNAELLSTQRRRINHPHDEGS